MPEQFRFEATNDVVTKTLTATEIAGVTRWQAETTDFLFEFHTMHEAGWPCYLREPDGPARNLPKINLKVYKDELLQSASVRSVANKDEFKAVIKANTDLFKKLAEAYYEGEDDEVVAKPSWYVEYHCTKPRSTAASIFVRLPERGQAIGKIFWSNMKNRAKTPTCVLHRSSACMEVKDPVQMLSTDVKKPNKLCKFNDASQVVDFLA
ncbi:MAG: hypothetical protein OEZ33_11930 [Gammaproteobacteria bacterium]|nr:hypothetical protein [Gammaproteobacteria bacterium]